MKARSKRLETIIKILSDNNVSNQSQLIALLAEEGYIVTQPTLSHDLRKLNTIKVPNERGDSIYMVPDMDRLKEHVLCTGNVKGYPKFVNGFISLTFSGNLAVIKTRNGYASGLAYDIDAEQMPEILGTIAGADTIMAVIDENVSRQQALSALGKVLPLNGRNKNNYK